MGKNHLKSAFTESQQRLCSIHPFCVLNTAASFYEAAVFLLQLRSAVYPLLWKSVKRKPPIRRQILHRDIKSDNILYHALFDAHELGDFGIAGEHFDTANTLTRGIGTARFIAPEVEAGSAYDHQADPDSIFLILSVTSSAHPSAA